MRLHPGRPFAPAESLLERFDLEQRIVCADLEGVRARLCLDPAAQVLGSAAIGREAHGLARLSLGEAAVEVRNEAYSSGHLFVDHPQGGHPREVRVDAQKKFIVSETGLGALSGGGTETERKGKENLHFA